jgi:RNA polymerase sigma-54 factor
MFRVVYYQWISMAKRPIELQQRPEVRQYLLPSLTYYLKLLELPNLELDETVQQELDTNPVLEESTNEPEEPAAKSLQEQKNDLNEFSILDLFAGDANIPYGTYEHADDSELYDPLENAPAQDDKLFGHLMRQAERKFKGKDLEIAELIISCVDDDGRLTSPLEELAQNGFELTDVSRIRKEILHFDPAGCAWLDIKEPLLAQLEKMGYGPESVECILVRECLPSMKNNHEELMSRLGVGEELINKARKVIMKLDPKPGLQFSGAPLKYVLPDFIIYWRDNSLVARLNDENTYRVRVRSQYLEKVKNPSSVPPEELEFIKQRLQAAQNLIFAIEQRRKTLLRILNSVLEYQRDYFEKGPSFLKPLTMVDFARQLGVNPSTISRALANKYLECPWGIHKMKFFFTAPIGTSDKRHVFEKIKEIVA